MKDYSNSKNLKHFKNKLKPKGYTLHTCIVCGITFPSKVTKKSTVKKMYCSSGCRTKGAKDPIIREKARELEKEIKGEE